MTTKRLLDSIDNHIAVFIKMYFCFWIGIQLYFKSIIMPAHFHHFSYRKILTYIRAEHLTITGFSQEITMIDDGITSNPEKFVTEIRIPVDEK